MTALGVRRGKAAFFSGCKSHPATIAPAGSNRSSHGGDEMPEAFGIASHELVSLDFRCGSTTDSTDCPATRPLIPQKQTKIMRKRTCRLECLLSSVEQTLPLEGGLSGVCWVSHNLHSRTFHSVINFYVSLQRT